MSLFFKKKGPVLCTLKKLKRNEKYIWMFWILTIYNYFAYFYFILWELNCPQNNQKSMKIEKMSKTMKSNDIFQIPELRTSLAYPIQFGPKKYHFLGIFCKMRYHSDGLVCYAIKSWACNLYSDGDSCYFSKHCRLLTLVSRNLLVQVTPNLR